VNAPKSLAETFNFAAELIRLLHFSKNNNPQLPQLPEMELVTMHVLGGRFQRARHREAYRQLSEQARTKPLDVNMNRMVGELLLAQSTLAITFENNRICPNTRQDAFLQTLLAQPLLTRASVAGTVNVSDDTATRWFERLELLGIVTRIHVRNVDVFAVTDFLKAVLREHRRQAGMGCSDIEIERLMNHRVEIVDFPKIKKWYEPTGRKHRRGIEQWPKSSKSTQMR
jgi:hypothetical protein